MILNILLCDTFPGLLPPSIQYYEDLFIDLLFGTSEDNKMEYVIYEAFNGQFPQTLHRDELYLIPGSMSGAYEEKEWIKELLSFIRDAHQAKVPLVGVCFGHQAIAQALGGKVAPAPQGWGNGIRTSAITDKAAIQWFPKGTVTLHYNHHDQVTELPPDAKRWATSDFCLNEGFIIGNHILTFQGHPEYTDEYNHYLITNHSDGEPKEVIEKGLKSIETLNHQGTIAAKWMLSLVQ